MELLPKLLSCASVSMLLLSCGGGGGDGGGGNNNSNSNLNIDVGGGSFSSGDIVSDIEVGQRLNFTFTNDGATAVRLNPVLLAGVDDEDVRDFELEFTSDFAVTTAGSPPPRVEWAPMRVVEEDPAFGLTLEPELAGIQAWARAAEQVGAQRVYESFALPGEAPVDLILKALASPFNAETEIRVDGREWLERESQLDSDLSFWMGSIAGEPDSTVYLSFSSRGIRGWITRAEQLFLVSPRADDLLGWEAMSVHVTDYARLQQSQGLEAPSFSCHPVVPDEVEPFEGVNDFEGDLGTASDSGAIRRCRVGFETDEAFFDEFGDTGAATTFVAQMLAAVGHRYQQRAQTQLEVQYLALYDAQPDPWVAPEGGGTISDLLQEFAAHWGTSWPGAAANAEIGHLLVRGMDAGGIAYYDSDGVLCNRQFSFGVSTDVVNGTLPWGDFDFVSASGYWDFVVVAHEMGHNFGANHTHDYCPPFDECSTVFGTCQTTRDCQKSSILSYCHTCPGGLTRIDPDFEPYVATQMRLAIDDSCLPRINLAPGETLRFTVTYQPKTAGASEVELSWTHNAANLPSPFRLILQGN